MSSYLVHIGYILKIAPQSVVREVQVIACSNVETCNRTFNERAKFCKHCGSPVVLFPKKRTILTTDCYDLLPPELSALVQQLDDTNLWRMNFEILRPDGSPLKFEDSLAGQSGGVEFDPQDMADARALILQSPQLQRITNHLDNAYSPGVSMLVFGAFSYWGRD